MRWNYFFIGIRGTDGIKGKPLFVIDGERMAEDFDLNSIKSDEIESISILKNKNAIELYGEKAKDGVIIINKKKL